MTDDDTPQLPRISPLPPLPLQEMIFGNPGGDDRVRRDYETRRFRKNGKNQLIAQMLDQLEGKGQESEKA